MDLSYFTILRQYPVSRMIWWLKNRSLLANPLHCGACHEDMVMVGRTDGHIDGYQWLVAAISILYVYHIFYSRFLFWKVIFGALVTL